MDNLEVAEKWAAWAEQAGCYAGDVTPASESKVDFWFGKNGEEANSFLHCFATGGDGSLIALYAPEGGEFGRGPVVHLGHEGDVMVIAEDVPHALALFAAAGESYERAIYGERQGKPDSTLSQWLKKSCKVELPKDVRAAVEAADTRAAAIKNRIRWLSP